MTGPSSSWRRVCSWCEPAHDLGPAPALLGGDVAVMCEAARARMLGALDETPSAVCLHGLGKDEFCIGCEASNNESRSIG